MFKSLFQLHSRTNDSDKILGLFSFNALYTVVQHWATQMEPILHNILLLGQIAVVAVTIRYILKRTKALADKSVKKDDE